MGQYQQWLHCREVDQQLQAQLEALEKDLAQLEEQARLLEQSMGPPYYAVSPGTPLSVDQVFLQIDNRILVALATSFNGHVSPTLTISTETVPGESQEIISSALFACSPPDYGPQGDPVAPPGVEQPLPGSSLDKPFPAIPHSDMASLPEGLETAIDQFDQTEPQLEIPRWLLNITHARHLDGPIDKEAIRTNRLVQRWVERWGQPPSNHEKTRENK